MAGRKHGKVPFWYWLSDMTGKRVSWLFPSVKEANTWRNQRFWKYSKYPNIEDYLQTVPEHLREKETRMWNVHKDNFHDYILMKGVATYETRFSQPEQ